MRRWMRWRVWLTMVEVSVLRVMGNMFISKEDGCFKVYKYIRVWLYMISLLFLYIGKVF